MKKKRINSVAVTGLSTAFLLWLVLFLPGRVQAQTTFYLVQPDSITDFIPHNGGDCSAVDNNTVTCSYTSVPAGGGGSNGLGATFDVNIDELDAPNVPPENFVGIVMAFDFYTHDHPTLIYYGTGLSAGISGTSNRIHPSETPIICIPLGGYSTDPAWSTLPCDTIRGEWHPAQYPAVKPVIHRESPHPNISGFFTISYYYVTTEEPEEPPPPPPPTPGGIFGFCTFTTTVTLTETISISPSIQTTTTQIITYTREGNLVDNYSFETPNPNGPGPAGWTPSTGGTVNTDVPDFYEENGIAHSGSDSVFNAGVFDLYTSVVTRKSGDYAIGYFANGANTELYWNGVLKSSSTAVTSTFQIYTNTFAVGGGASWLHVAFLTDDEATNVDDVFVYPVDEFGNLLCDPDYYAPYDPDDETINIGGIPGPIGGAGTTCYRCTPPSNLSSLSISYWIAWLGCVLRNMFACSLRVWLLVIGNWLMGQIQIALAWLVWTPQTVQGGVNWFAGAVAPLLGGVKVVYQNSTNLWDLLIVIIGLIATIILSLSSLIITIIQMIIGFIVSIRAAFAVDPYVFNFAVSGGGPAPGAPALAMDGPNDDKILYLFLVALGVIDQSFIGTHAEILLIVMGIVAIGVAIWTLNFWKELVSF